MVSLHEIVFYDDRSSLELLVGAIIVDTPFKTMASILAQASLVGLIKIPFFLRSMTKIISIGTAMTWISAFFQRDREREKTEGTWINLLSHVLLGSDKTDKNSAGGLNKTELWTFLEILEFNGFTPSELMLSHAERQKHEH